MPADGQPCPPAVRPASAADAAALAGLSAEMGYPATARDILRRMPALDPGDGVFVAELGGAVVGFVHVFERRLLVTEPFAELGALVVAATARRRGVGRALLDEATAWARRNRLTTLRVRAGAERPEAHDFYSAAGCRFVKEQRINERPSQAAGS